MRKIESVLDYLQCTKCGGDLRTSGSVIECTVCSTTFNMENGIPNFWDKSSTFSNNQFWLKAQVGDEAKDFWDEEQKGDVPEWWRNSSIAAYEKFLELRQGVTPNTCLEIGGGSIPKIFWVPSEIKLALDPLMNQQVKLFSDKYKDIACMTGIGESMPVKDNFIDYMVVTNCLDHFSNPKKGVSEILRVLSSDGLCFITLDTFAPWWKLERQLRDKSHEYRWTSKDQKMLLESSGAVIRYFCVNPPAIKASRKKQYDADWKYRLNVLLGRRNHSWIFISKR